MALDQVEAWLESPSLFLMTEAEGYWATLRTLIDQGRIAGPRVHDARVAALCLNHSIRELWTATATSRRFRHYASATRWWRDRCPARQRTHK